MSYPHPFLSDSAFGISSNNAEVWQILVPDLSEKTLWLIDNAPVNSLATVSPTVAPNFIGARSLYIKVATGAGFDKWQPLITEQQVQQVIQQVGGGTPRRTSNTFLHIEQTGAIDSVSLSERRNISYFMEVNSSWVDTASSETLFAEETYPNVLITAHNRFQSNGLANLRVTMGQCVRSGNAIPNFHITAAWNESGIIVSANASVPLIALFWSENNYLP